IIVLLLAKWAAQLWLDRLNARNVLAHSGAVPDAFKATIDETTYAKSTQYTLARGRLDQVAVSVNTAVLLLVLLTGVLPWSYRSFTGWHGGSAWAMAAFLFLVGLAFSATGLPLDWYHQFRLEQRFGFNTTTQKLWWMDRLKGLLLAGA